MSAPETLTPYRRLRRLSYAAFRVLLAVSLMAYLVVEVVQQWDAIRTQVSHPLPLWLLLSTVGLLAHFVFLNENWRVIMKRLGAPVSFRRAFRIVFLSNMAKYMPGGVWNLVGRVALCRVAKISGTTASMSLVLELVAGICAMAIVTVAVSGFMPEQVLPLSRATIAAIVVALILATHPRVVNGALAVVARVSRRPIDPMPFHYSFVIRMIGQYVAAWLVLVASFVWLAKGVLPGVTLADAPLLAGALSASWLIGMLAFVVPGGLGVRDVLLVAIVAARFDDGLGAALAVASRIQILLAEGLVFVVALGLSDPEGSTQSSGGHDQG